VVRLSGITSEMDKQQDGDRTLPRRSSRENIGVPANLFGSYLFDPARPQSGPQPLHSTVVTTSGLVLNRTTAPRKCEDDDTASISSAGSRTSVQRSRIEENNEEIERLTARMSERASKMMKTVELLEKENQILEKLEWEDDEDSCDDKRESPSNILANSLEPGFIPLPRRPSVLHPPPPVNSNISLPVLMS